MDMCQTRSTTKGLHILGGICDCKEAHGDPGPFQNPQYKSSILELRLTMHCLCPPPRLWQRAVQVRCLTDALPIVLVSQLVLSSLSRATYPACYFRGS